MLRDPISTLQKSIEDRQDELQSVTLILAKAAKGSGFRATTSKVSVIFLGAFAATRGAMDQIVGGTSNRAVLLTYTVAGLLTATIAGLEAAFKTEGKSAELKQLAATCQSTVRLVDTQWRKQVSPAYGDDRIEAARNLLDLQDTKLAEIQQQAARLGVNITLHIRELQQSDNWPQPTHQPYSA
jgi:hypothetical protein